MALHKWSILRIIAGLVVFNVVTFAVFLVVGLTSTPDSSNSGGIGGGSSGYLSAGLLAYTFGLRHALDADHIAVSYLSFLSSAVLK